MRHLEKWRNYKQYNDLRQLLPIVMGQVSSYIGLYQLAQMKDYFAEIAETGSSLICAILGHWNGCAVLSYRTRHWNPIAFLYHWGTDVAFERGRDVQRCGCTYPPRVTTVSTSAGVNVFEVTMPNV